MLKRVKLSSLKPNPWRQFETYEFVDEKLVELDKSITKTGFWAGSLTVRPSYWRGDEPIGPYELASGHHRWKAAKVVLGEGAFVEVIVEDMDDDTMYERMCYENNDAYSTTTQAMDVEEVKSLLEGHVAGKLTIDKSKGKALDVGMHVDIPHTVGDIFVSRESIMKKTGLSRHRVENALSHLKLMREGITEAANLQNISPRQGQELAAQTRRIKARVKDPEKAKEVVKKVAETMQNASKGKAKNSPDRSGYRKAKLIAEEEISKANDENQDIKRFIREIDSTASKLKTAATKLRELNNMLVMAKVEQFTGPQAADLREAMRRVQESCRMFDMEWPAKPQPKIKLVK